MSFVSMKLLPYILPIWPVLSIAVAGTIKTAERGELLSGDLAWLSRGRWLFGVFGLAGGAALVIVPWFIPALGFSMPGGEAEPLFFGARYRGALYEGTNLNYLKIIF
jgi:hypothetical protein